MTEVAIRETLSPVERLETTLHLWVSFAIMPRFAAKLGILSASVASAVAGLAVLAWAARGTRLILP